jgi:hypothetical protein
MSRWACWPAHALPHAAFLLVGVPFHVRTCMVASWGEGAGEGCASVSGLRCVICFASLALRLRVQLEDNDRVKNVIIKGAHDNVSAAAA